MNYYISDLHLFHNNILNLPNCNRPFQTIEEMHEKIKVEWIKKVTYKDKVYILGDVGMYHERDIADFLRNLPGKKFLVTGNHDVFNIRDKDFCLAFAWIRPYAEIWDEKRKVVLFHYPIQEWNGSYRDAYHVHGHVHAEKLDHIPKRYNVSCDVVDFTPQSLDELIQKHDPELSEIHK